MLIGALINHALRPLMLCGGGRGNTPKWHFKDVCTVGIWLAAWKTVVAYVVSHTGWNHQGAFNCHVKMMVLPLYLGSQLEGAWYS